MACLQMSGKWAVRPAHRQGLISKRSCSPSPTCLETSCILCCPWLPKVAGSSPKGCFTFVSSPSESRRILLPVVLHHIHLHLRQQKELLICSGILGSIFSIVKTSSLVVTLDLCLPRP